MKERETDTEKYSLEISVFEVYNNEINDLLASGDVSAQSDNASNPFNVTRGVSVF